MNRLLCLLLIFSAFSISPLAQAQTADPVSSTLRQVLDRYSKNLVASAEEMPADKYSYHPTPEQMTFGKVIAHVAQVNNFACSKVSGAAAPKAEEASETDKETPLRCSAAGHPHGSERL